MRLLPRPRRRLSRRGRVLAWIGTITALLIIAVLAAVVLAPFFTDAELAADSQAAIYRPATANEHNPGDIPSSHVPGYPCDRLRSVSRSNKPRPGRHPDGVFHQHDCRPSLLHDDGGSHRHAVIEVDDVVVGQANASV